MKLNLKKFLSTLCVVTSVSSVFAATSANAVGIPGPFEVSEISDLDGVSSGTYYDYSSDPEFGPVVDETEYDATLSPTLLNLIRHRRYCLYSSGRRRWYNNVRELVRNGTIDTYEAVMLVLISNTRNYTHFIRNYHVKKWLCTHDWSKLELIMNHYSRNFLRLSLDGSEENIIGIRSFEVFGQYQRGELDLLQTLEMLNPAHRRLREILTF